MRAANVSLVAAAAAAVVLLAVWRLWRTEEVVQPYRQTLANVELEWKCAAGHSFRAAGHTFDTDGLTKPRLCWTCDRAAYPVARYTCLDHGSYELAVRFAVGDDGVAKVSQVRWPGQSWVSAEEGLHCPKCNAPLVYTRKDPLQGIGRAKKKGGG
ncbi:MAG: hypothetical protein WBE26_12435 [Phycisphaerae bacterium]